VTSAEIIRPAIKQNTANELDVGVLTADDTLEFELVPYDQYGNIANPTEEEINLDIFVPGCADETSGTCQTVDYTTEKNMKNNHFTYTVQTTNKGDDWKIVSAELFAQDKGFHYRFPVVAGKVSTGQTEISLSSNAITAGQSVTVTISPKDQYGQAIDVSRLYDDEGKELMGQFLVDVYAPNSNLVSTTN